MKIDADGAWKDVCAEKLPLAFELLSPEAHGAVDWAADYEPLDAELRRLTADVLEGNRVADRLIKASAPLTGDPRYFHVEAQGKKERGFARRVHVCNARCEERFASHVTSFVIYTDADPNWRPRRYVAGCLPVEGRKGRYHDERTLRFLTAKLTDFEGREAELEAGENPLGLVVVAHLAALRARRDEGRRASAKLRLLLNLRQRKMTPADVQFWVRCLDRLLPLRGPRQREIWDRLEALDTEQDMAFVSYAEQRGLEKGIEQGIEKGIEQGLEKGLEQGIGQGRRESLAAFLRARYRAESAGLLDLLKAAPEARLAALCDEVFAADSLDAVRAALTAPAP